MSSQQEERPRKRLARADRQAQIIKAAQEVFVESGLGGTRTREIAERAGITEAYLYRHFSSKEELYTCAVEEPLTRLVGTLHEEIDTLKAVEGIRREELLDRANLVFLEAMVEITPLLTVAIFAELSKGRVFYSESVRPRLQEAFESIIVDVSGWSSIRVDTEVVVLAFFGIHYALCLDYMLRGRKLNVAEIAHQVTTMYSSGIKEFAGGASSSTADRKGAAKPVRKTAAAKVSGAKPASRTPAKPAPRTTAAKSGRQPKGRA